jgi:hypothetical protein
MKKYILTLIIALSIPMSVNAKDCWEYKVLKGNHSDQLSEYGKQGWRVKDFGGPSMVHHLDGSKFPSHGTITSKNWFLLERRCRLVNRRSQL